MILAIVGTVIGVGGLFFAWYAWTHESPRLRHNREGELEAVAIKAVEIALAKTGRSRNEVVQVAHASATAAIMEITGSMSATQAPQTEQATGRVDPPGPGGVLWTVKGPGESDQGGPR